MASTFLLVQTDPGSAEATARWLRDLPAVKTAVVTSGPYDVVAQYDTDDPRARAEVCEQVRQLIGQTRLLCICSTSGDEPKARSSWSYALASNA